MLALTLLVPASLLPALFDAGAALQRTYHLYAAAESADQVFELAFDGHAFTTTHVIDVGYQATEVEGPHGLTVGPMGDFWYVTLAHGKPNGSLYKYATGTNELVGQVELGLFPATMQISADTGLLYCVNFDLHGEMEPSTVSIVDVDALAEVGRTTTGVMPHGSRISPDGKRQYSCAMMSGELFELDTATFEVVRKLTVDDGTGTGALKKGAHGPTSKPTWVQPHPKEARVYVALNGAHQVVEVDLKKWQVTRRFPTGRAPYNLDVTPDGARLVVTYKGAQSVGVIDLKTGEELARIDTSRRVPHGVVVSPDGRYAFITSEGIGAESGTVDAIDLETLKLVATAEIGLQAGGIAYWKTEDHEAQ